MKSPTPSKALLSLGVLAAIAIPVAVFAMRTGDEMVAASASEVKPIKVGTAVPDSSVLTLDKKETTFKKVLNGKPAVVIFYRGGWCPFCNRHLSDLMTVEADLRKLGFQVIAVTPDTPDELSKTMEKDKLNYTLVSDSKAELIKKFGIAFRVDDKTFTMYRDQYKIDLEKSSGGQTHHILPVPAVFLIDAKGTIQFVSTNPDYKVRMKGADILEAAQKMGM
ncbi:MAG: AhpC/TSA family protein [Fimbriimonadaceae bacterium]|nr:AhpC/TSA family protein [Fimbriimonadaceae bacterium]